MLERLREGRDAPHAADAVELEQARLRVGINILILLYIFGWSLWDRVLDDGELVVLGGGAVFIAFAFAQLGWVLRRPGVDHLRRRVAVLLDVGTLSGAMTLGGEGTAVLCGFYLWIVIGNGFRFGRWYLHYAQAMAIAGFALVLWFSPFWRGQIIFSAALFLMLMGIPFYVAVLISRLQATSLRLDEARGEAEAANTAKTRFLAAASHDLRQPMQALSMYASVLEERVADAGGRRVVHGIQLSVKTLERLFDSLLDISKIESGVITPSVVEFPLMPLIEQVVEAEQPIAAQKGLDLRVVRTALSVRSDPALLERMLKNLVTNAIRYTEQGRIVIGCRRVGGERVRLEVADSGIGIATQEQVRIFEEYYQIEGASAQGLGLGLPIVRSLGALLGHKVLVRSAFGRGSVFSIELPRAANVALAPAAAPVLSAMNGAHVVLVDDDVEIRQSMQLLLESWGCHFISGASVLDVEEKLREQRVRPDALIVDYRLADAMTGIQVIERLRAAFGKELPALMITGTANVALVQQRAPHIPIAAKPVAPGKLRAFLSQTMLQRAAAN
jgi:signal transduction histidine kinase/CheY-like chemotaxis protein